MMGWWWGSHPEGWLLVNYWEGIEDPHFGRAVGHSWYGLFFLFIVCPYHKKTSFGCFDGKNIFHLRGDILADRCIFDLIMRHLPGCAYATELTKSLLSTQIIISKYLMTYLFFNVICIEE